MNIKDSNFSFTEFSKKINNEITEIEDVINITTDRQLKNGTLMFKDLQTNTLYGVYTRSGYVRRHVVCVPYWRPKQPITMMYQLNKKTLTPDKRFTMRILIEDTEIFIETVKRGIFNYRKN